MLMLLEIRANLIDFYKKHDNIITYIWKFLLGFILIMQVNSLLGYKNILLSIVFATIIGGISSVITGTGLLIITIGYIVVNLFSLSAELGIFTAIILLLSYLLLISMSSKTAYFTILIPLLFPLKIVYLVPILAGIFFGPIAILSIVLGVIWHYYMISMPMFRELISSSNEPLEVTIGIYNYFIRNIIYNEDLLIGIIVFSLVVIISYIICKLQFDFSHYLAIIFGGIISFIGIIIGGIIINEELPILFLIFGHLASITIIILIQFFRFPLDYERKEFLQFEDDDYYYYVKAVPKVQMSKTIKEIKKIE